MTFGGDDCDDDCGENHTYSGTKPKALVERRPLREPLLGSRGPPLPIRGHTLLSGCGGRGDGQVGLPGGRLKGEVDLVLLREPVGLGLDQGIRSISLLTEEDREVGGEYLAGE